MKDHSNPICINSKRNLIKPNAIPVYRESNTNQSKYSSTQIKIPIQNHYNTIPIKSLLIPNSFRMTIVLFFSFVQVPWSLIL